MPDPDPAVLERLVAHVEHAITVANVAAAGARSVIEARSAMGQDASHARAILADCEDQLGRLNGQRDRLLARRASRQAKP
jgi:hypothetical protein